MNNSCRLIDTIDTAPIINEINEEHYKIETIRQKVVKEQKYNESIFLRHSPFVHKVLEARHNQDVCNTKLYNLYPHTTQYIRDFAADPNRGNGHLSRIIIARLQPKSNIEEHIDVGMYHVVRKRYHIVVKSPNGSIMNIDGKDYIWTEGEVYWFNNNITHHVRNDSEEWRTHIIFDIIPFDRFELTKQLRAAYYDAIGIPQFIIDDFRYL